MRKLVLISITSTFFLASCQLNQSKDLKKMTDEICFAMEQYDESNPISLLLVADSLASISEEAQTLSKREQLKLKRLLESKCPDGFNKLNALISSW
ncbi:MAG: hypothetical protein IPM71_06145 [Bacteroidota bacterium]|nr:MAG: hypothetical protein IPM71_06145 [Bacteroidota bacterium]